MKNSSIRFLSLVASCHVCSSHPEFRSGTLFSSLVITLSGRKSVEFEVADKFISMLLPPLSRAVCKASMLFARLGFISQSPHAGHL